jgi:dynein heavy chain
MPHRTPSFCRLPTLERQVELLGDDPATHPRFRVFLSAEPPPLPSMTNMPESLLRSCVKVANEAPSDLASNLSRAWAMFNQGTLDSVPANAEAFKAALLGLCWYHSLILGRRKFGQVREGKWRLQHDKERCQRLEQVGYRV